MPKTEYFGFPLMANVPPEGTTGKDLRDAILGEGKNSLASMVDDALHGVESKIPDADRFETTDNKLERYNGDFEWYGDESSDKKYPSLAAVYEFVQNYVLTHMDDNLELIFSVENLLNISPLIGEVVVTEHFGWNGVTDGYFNLLEQFYKIGNSTPMEGKFITELTAGMFPLSFLAEPTITDLKDTLGIVVYTISISGSDPIPIVIVADRNGMVPAAVVEAFMGTNPGVDIPYEAGTYVLNDGEMFVSSMKHCLPIKDYIDKRASQVHEPIAEWDGSTDGRSNFLEMFYKVSDNKVALPLDQAAGSIVTNYNKTHDRTETFEINGLTPDLIEAFGIYIYTYNDAPIVVIATRSGSLPAFIVESLTGINPGMDVPYETGTFFRRFMWDPNTNESHEYISGLTLVYTTKQYIDKRLEELR